MATTDDSGFDKLLRRKPKLQPTFTESQASSSVPNNTGTSVTGGVSRSADKKLIVDWNKSEISVADGARKRVDMGNLDGTGVYGFRVTDSLGNTRFEASSDRVYAEIAGRQVSVGTEGDDFTDIQAATDFISSTGGGGTVFIKRGTYTITSNILIPNNVYLVGEDPINTILDFNQGTANISNETVVANGDPANIRIESLKFQNCWNTTTGTIYFHTAVNIVIENCYFANNRNNSDNGCDIYLDTIGSIKVRDCESNGAGKFVYFDNASGSNEFTSNRIFDSRQVVFTGGTTASGGGQGIYQNNEALGPRSSVFSGNYEFANITGNLIDYNVSTTATAIDLTDSDYLSITNNDIVLFVNGISAIHLSNCYFPRIANNYMEGRRSGIPIVVLSGVNDGTVIGNIFYATASGVISFDGLKIEKLVSGGTINSNRNKVMGNTSFGYGPSSYGVNIADSSCGQNIVIGNSLFGNTGSYNDSGTGSVIANNS